MSFVQGTTSHFIRYVVSVPVEYNQCEHIRKGYPFEFDDIYWYNCKNK